MEPKEKKAFEPSGLVPRSIVRTFERFRQQLLPGSETAAIREYRISRYQVLVSARCLFTLLIIPITTNWLVSSWLLSPLVEHFWNTQQNEIFLNSYQEERAFAELESFSEKLFFESLLNTTNTLDVDFTPYQLPKPHTQKADFSATYIFDVSTKYALRGTRKAGGELVSSSFAIPKGEKVKITNVNSVGVSVAGENSLKIKEKVQNKILELAVYYNQQTIISITNIVGDVVSLITLACLFIWMKPEITILKSFLIEAIYSLSDTTKSFLLILLTDLLVGFHSPRGWETALELLLKHFGLPENQDFVFLFVATFPVLLDTVFKYWIFRHLNKISPSTVATYHSMIE